MNVDKLDKVLDKKWRMILSAEETGKYRAILDYLFFLKEQYEKGSMGYMMYPYYVTSLLALNAEEYPELEKIIDLAITLEIPNEKGDTNPRIRLEETERLSKMIEGLKH